MSVNGGVVVPEPDSAAALLFPPLPPAAAAPPPAASSSIDAAAVRLGTQQLRSTPSMALGVSSDSPFGVVPESRMCESVAGEIAFDGLCAQAFVEVHESGENRDAVRDKGVRVCVCA
jgi:hypothetical protein